MNIIIPDKGNEFYDMDAEIVFKKNSNFISVILTDLNVEEIIENQTLVASEDFEKLLESTSMKHFYKVEQKYFY